MVVKGLTFALSHNLQLRTDGDDYLFDTIDNNGNGDEEVCGLEDKSKSCSYLRISNDVHRALFGCEWGNNLTRGEFRILLLIC